MYVVGRQWAMGGIYHFLCAGTLDYYYAVIQRYTV